MLTKLTAREVVIRTLGGFKVSLNEALINEIMAQVEEQKPTSPNDLSYVIARNKAIDILRREEKERRDKFKELLKAEKEQQRKKQLEIARQDFWKAVERALTRVSKTAENKAAESLTFLELKIFEKKSCQQLKDRHDRHPQLSIDSVKQMIRRARLMIRPYVSPLLWKVITRGCNKKTCQF